MYEMDQLGLGVLIKQLGGNTETIQAIKDSIGKEIASITKADETLRFSFKDGSILEVWDGGQSCCEHRYMVVDDKLSEFIGSTLLGFEIKEAPSLKDDVCDVHDVQFLDVKTSKGVFQVASHNEHNGYYGGFYIEARFTPPSTHEDKVSGGKGGVE